MALDTLAEIDAAIAEAGVPVSSAASSTFGVLDMVGAVEQTDAASFQRTATTLTIRTGTITDLAESTPLTVNGLAYVARWFEPIEDGALTTIVLVRVTP